MDLRSEEATERYHLGIRWGTLNGRSGWMHVWSDGTTLPVIAGCAPDDDDADDDDDDAGKKGAKDDKDDDDDDEEEEDEDEDDDDDEEDPDKIKDPKRRESARQAARYRVQRNEARKARDGLKTKLAEVEKELKDLREKGSGDETLKARVKELEKSVDEKDAEIKQLSKAATDAKVRASVSSVRDELKVKDDLDYVMYVLDRNDLTPKVDDEDGTVDDVEVKRTIRKLIKRKKLNVTSGDDGKDDEEDDEEDERSSGGSSRRSAPKSFNSEKKGKGASGKSLAQLAEKYPALANR